MDQFAHQTLELRSFYHEFPKNKAPNEYYQYLKGRITKDELFNKYPNEAKMAKRRAIKARLGSEDDKIIYEKIQTASIGL